MGLSTGDKVEAKYNRPKGMADLPEKSVGAGSPGKVVKVHIMTDAVDVEFDIGYGRTTTHRKVSPNDLKKT